MAEDEKRGSIPAPSARAEHAAKKLGLARGASGRFDSVRGPKSDPNPSMSSSVRTSSKSVAPAESAEKVPAAAAVGRSDTDRVSDAAREAAREARFAGRRSLVSSDAQPAAEKPAPEKKSKEAKPALKSPIVIFGGGLLLLGALAFGTSTALRLRYENSDEGRVRAGLADADFALHDAAARDAAYAALDALPQAPKTAIDMLTDANVVTRGSSRSTHKVQEVANAYLIHYASTKKIDPPAKATEVAKAVFDGQNPGADQWAALQDAWRGAIK